MERFVRIFETEKTQVLVFEEYELEEDVTVLHQICNIGGTRIDAKLFFEGENQRETALKVIEEYSSEKAERFVEALTERFGGME